MVRRLSDPARAAELFAGWQETMIWSALEGIMGTVYAVDDASALIRSGDLAFFAGKPSRELAEALRTAPFVIAVPKDEAWARLLERVHGEHARRGLRYAFDKQPGIFDFRKLEQMAATLPEGITLRAIDEELYERCKQEIWSRDWVSQYPNFAMYQRLGLGVAALRGGEIVAGASSYCTYRGGIEIQIDTREDYRRRGLATACGAALILECERRGLYPSWDAENVASVALAEKLGYLFSHTYPIYEISYCLTETRNG
ncbi:MAG: GNAT family N-acetyltransferase [Firmicutes bacterium]|nr:GNAT family N-acetyltransferase [Bacillota bacterium]